MKPAFYTGAAGLIAQQERLNVIGHNIANVNTYGYKAQTTSFQSLLNSEMYVNTDNLAFTGHGVRILGTGIQVGSAALIQTGGETDFAIGGNGWFAVESGGQTQYTREGTFSLSEDGSKSYLVTSDGGFVLDAKGRKIAVEKESNQLALAEKIGVFNFSNSGALQPVTNNRFLATALSGTAETAKQGEYQVLPGCLEQSGVSLTDEMANMIMAQRAYQLSARVVQAADEIEQTVNSLRK